VRGPGWQPSYRATLDAAKPSVLIERQALVAQNSGEDWSNVQLTLSTGQPGAPPRAACPGRGRWTWHRPPPSRPMRHGHGSCPRPRIARPWNAARPKTMPSFDVSTDKGFATEFAVPQRITVPSNGQRVTLALGSHTAPPRLLVRTAPAVEEAAYLVADWPRPRRVAGGQPTCTATAPTWAPAASTLRRPRTGANGTSSLAFGRDELVTVRAEPVQDLTGSTGFTGSRVERRTRRATPWKTATRPHHAAGAARRACFAQREDRGRIALPAPAHRPGLEPQPRHRGLAAALAAGATAQFSAEHTIRYPKDMELQERP
jgi:hypothetical protein